MPEKPQALEEQKFRLKMEESRLNLEAETAKRRQRNKCWQQWRTRRHLL